MLLIKKGLPEEEELVICTVTKVQLHSVFCNLDEYNKTGMIHISEVSPGRIRNIRDFVKEGKKVVCKVLRINQERGHIDLTLRRVTETQKRQKIDEIKQEQKAEKIIEFVAKNTKCDINKLFTDIYGKVSKKFPSLHAYFQEFVTNPKIIEILDLDKKVIKSLEETIRQRIKEAKVEIEGNLKISSYQPNGIEIIKNVLVKTEEASKENLTIRYLGGGTYHIKVNGKAYKEAESILKKSIDGITDFISKTGGITSFERAS